MNQKPTLYSTKTVSPEYTSDQKGLQWYEEFVLNWVTGDNSVNSGLQVATSIAYFYRRGNLIVTSLGDIQVTVALPATTDELVLLPQDVPAGMLKWCQNQPSNQQFQVSLGGCDDTLFANQITRCALQPDGTISLNTADGSDFIVGGVGGILVSPFTWRTTSSINDFDDSILDA